MIMLVLGIVIDVLFIVMEVVIRVPCDRVVELG